MKILILVKQNSFIERSSEKWGEKGWGERKGKNLGLTEEKP